MPKPITRFPRLASAATAAACAILLVACSGGGGGGGGGEAAGNGSAAAGPTTSVSLGWVNANGPVAGYSVYVQRNDGAFKHETDVSASSVTLRGAPGSTARVAVVAFDAGRAYGPASPTSPVFTFPNLDGTTNASPASSDPGTGNDPTGGNPGATDPGSNPASPTPGPSEEPTPGPGTLVWQAGEAFRLTDTALVTTRLFTAPEAGARLVGTADFDADGEGDLLWRRATAQLAYTSGSALRSGADPIPLVDLGALAEGEIVLGTGDLDDDGDGDVVVASADAVRARLTVAGAAPVVNELGTAAQAVLEGIADFDTDGSEDLVWRSSTGQIVIWLIRDGALLATVEVVLADILDPIGAGDFNGDGSGEIVLRGSSGAAFVVRPLVEQPQLESTDLTYTSTWTSVGAADIDGDGSEELVLGTPGAARIARLPGDQVLSLEPASPWSIVALLP